MITGTLMYDIEIEVQDENELKNLEQQIQNLLLKNTQGVTGVENVDSDLDESEEET